MATERIGPALLVALLGLFPGTASAQQSEGPSLLLLDGETRVATVRFRFSDGQSLEEGLLRAGIGLHSPGGLGKLRRTLDWLPFVSGPALMPFDPITVQEDKIRLTRIFRREGFPEVAVAYQVRLDTAANTVRVDFEIDQGPPLRLDSVRVVDTAGQPLTLAPDLEEALRRHLQSLGGHGGQRLGEQLQTRIRSRLLDWLMNHGYAFAVVRDTVVQLPDQPQEDRLRADLILRADPGPQASVGTVTVEGNSRLGEESIVRELPFREGDPFRLSHLLEGQRQVFGLDLVRLALVDVVPDQPHDSTADVLVTVNEGSLRLLDGRIGYASEGGLAGDASWQHRNFLGGARTFAVDALARTGVWASGTGPQVRLVGSVTLRQPHFGHRQLTGELSPFVEYRNDQLDQSTRTGFDATTVWERGALRSVSLRYGFSVRRVSTTRGGGLAGASDLISLLQAIDTTDLNVRSSVLGAQASWGWVNDLLNPRSGWVARIGADIAGPAGISTVEYGRLEGQLRGFLPLGRRMVLTGRLSGGRLLPFGQSAPESLDDGLPALLRLRDVVFDAGGTDDVRGWSAGLLGPKVADFDVRTSGDSVILRSAGRYVPLGGLARWTGSVELQLPMPFLGAPHAVFGFLDAGRVWIPDDRFFAPETLASLEDKVYAGTGGGLQFDTPFGPFRIALGYKLNPSPLDLRDPLLVGRALLLQQPVGSVPVESSRRWQLHLSLGRGL